MNIYDYPVWNKTNAYEAYYIVRYFSSLYIALYDIPAGVEIDDKSKWLMIFTNNTLVNHEKYQMLKIKQAAQGSGTVDQTYQPTSTNAQAGIAIAQALEAYRPYYDSGVITITPGFDIRNLNGIITTNFKDPFFAPVASSANQFKSWSGITIPQGMRPLEDIFMPVFFDGQLGQIKINATGAIQQKAPFAIDTSMPVRGVMSWTV